MLDDWWTRGRSTFILHNSYFILAREWSGCTSALRSVPTRGGGYLPTIGNRPECGERSSGNLRPFAWRMSTGVATVASHPPKKRTGNGATHRKRCGVVARNRCGKRGVVVGGDPFLF